MCESLAGKHHSNQVSKLAVSENNLYSISMDDSFRTTSTETNEYRYLKLNLFCLRSLENIIAAHAGLLAISQLRTGKHLWIV